MSTILGSMQGVSLGPTITNSHGQAPNPVYKWFVTIMLMIYEKIFETRHVSHGRTLKNALCLPLILCKAHH